MFNRIIGKVKSAVYNEYHTEKYGKDMELRAYKLHIWVDKVDELYLDEIKILEICVYGEGEKRDAGGRIEYLRVKSPIFRTSKDTQIASFFDLHISKERGQSSVILLGKGFNLKRNKKGQRMVLGDFSKEFYSTKSPLLYSVWCPEVNKIVATKVLDTPAGLVEGLKLGI